MKGYNSYPSLRDVAIRAKSGGQGFVQGVREKRKERDRQEILNRGLKQVFEKRLREWESLWI